VGEGRERPQEGFDEPDKKEARSQTKQSSQRNLNTIGSLSILSYLGLASALGRRCDWRGSLEGVLAGRKGRHHAALRIDVTADTA
jgi:hypothetical protein